MIVGFERLMNKQSRCTGRFSRRSSKVDPGDDDNGL